MDKSKRGLLKVLKEKAIDLDWNQAFGGKSKGNKHLLRVNKIAKYLQRHEGGDLFIVLAGAWVHDVSLAFGNDNNPKLISQHTQRFLSNINGLSQNEANKITACAAFHEQGEMNISIEAQIVHDADVIDKSGLLGIIRHIWKMTNMLENRILTTKPDLRKLERHLKQREAKLFTTTAKTIAQHINQGRHIFFQGQSQPLKLMNLISIKASQGFTSDMIAALIARTRPGNISQRLNHQLRCKYLI